MILNSTQKGKEIAMIRNTRGIKSRIKTAVNPFPAPTDSVSDRLAKALVGQAVSLLVAPETITHGVVTDVLTEAGAPKIVVHGLQYPFSQVLTSVPASFAC